jgi:hypothetical protein
MEPTNKKIEIVGNSETRFGEATQNAVTKANESLHPIDWFTMAVQCVTFSRLLTDRKGKLIGTNLQEN